MRKREYDTALSLCKHLVEQNPENPDYRALYAESLVEAARTAASILEKGDFFSLAKEQLHEALELDGRNPLAMAVKGMFMVIRAEKNGTDPRVGIELLENAVQSSQLDDERKAKGYFGLSIGYFQTKQLEKAREACTMALELNPRFFPAQQLKSQLEKKGP